MNAMLDLDKPEEFVIATGKSYKMMQMVEIMFEIANIGNWKDYIDFDQSLLRPAEVPFLLGNPKKAEKIMGWTPDIRIEKLFEDMYQNDLNILKSK